MTIRQSSSAPPGQWACPSAKLDAIVDCQYHARMRTELETQPPRTLPCLSSVVASAVVGVVLMTASACSGKKPQAKTLSDEGGDGLISVKLEESKCRSDNKTVVLADTNRDEKPDVWKLYLKPEGTSDDARGPLVCKQVDLNKDGRVDLVTHFDSEGDIEAENADMDFDGRFDILAHYKNGSIVREDQDTNYDGQADVSKFYEGKNLARVEIDRDQDGVVDTWEYYEGGKLDRIGYDTTGSGKVDRWDRRTATAAPPTASPEPAPGAAATEPAPTVPPAPGS